MATTLTQLQDAIYKASQNDYFQKNENRPEMLGMTEVALADINLLLPKNTLEAIKKSSRQPTKIDVWQKRANGSATARACSGTGGASTTRQTVTYTGFTEDFSISALEFADNDFGRAEAISFNLADRIRALDERIEAYLVSSVDTQVTEGSGTIFTNFNDAKQVPLDKWDLSNSRAALWLNEARSEMAQNKYKGPFNLVGDPVMMSVTMAMLNQGAGNGINTGFQFNGFDMKFSNAITNEVSIHATAYIFQKGMFGMLTWVNALSRQGKDIGTDAWMVMAHPNKGYEIELKIKRSCVDNSGSFTGAEADYVESFVLHVDVAAVFGYSSDSNSGIYKYELDNDNTVQSGSGSYSE